MNGRIAVIGLNTIGIAIGLALRQSALDGIEVAGHDREPEVAKTAHRAGAIDVVELNLLSCVSGAHLIVICTPSTETLEVLDHIGPELPEGAVVTDTVGTKAAVLARARQCLPPTVSFVAGHVISGHGAPPQATANLFFGGTYCIIADDTTPRDAVRDVINLATLLGAQPYFMGIEEHDSYTVAAEILPTVVASALLEALCGSSGWTEISKIAGSSLRAATTPALTVPTTSRDEITANPELVNRWLGSFTQSLSKWQSAMLEDGESAAEALFTRLTETYLARDKWQTPEPPEEEGTAPMSTAAGLRQFFLGNLFRGRRR